MYDINVCSLRLVTRNIAVTVLLLNAHASVSETFCLDLYTAYTKVYKAHIPHIFDTHMHAPIHMRYVHIWGTRKCIDALVGI